MRHILPLTLLFSATVAATAANPLEYYSEPSDVILIPDMEGVTKILTLAETTGESHKGKTTCSFDGLLRPVSFEEFVMLQDSGWDQQSGVSYEWDDQGRCVREKTLYSESIWTFDEWGRLTKQERRSWDNNDSGQEPRSVSVGEYAYTADGHQSMSSTITTRLNPYSNEWKTSGTRWEQTYTTGSLGSPAREHYQSYKYDADTKNWIPNNRYDYSYKVDGGDFLTIVSASRFDSKTQTFKPATKEYQTSRKYADGLFTLIIKDLTYNVLEDGTERLTSEKIADFAENVDGRPYRIVETDTGYAYEGDERTITSGHRSTNYYDEVVVSGERAVRSIGGKREIWIRENDTWQTVSENSIVYDSEGRMLKNETLVYGSDGELSYGSRREETEYDGLGRVVRKSIYDMSAPEAMELKQISQTRRDEFAYYEDTGAVLRQDCYVYSSDGLEHSDILTWTYDYSIPSEEVGSLRFIPHKQKGSFLRLSMTNTNPYDGSIRETTKYTYTDRSALSGVEKVAAEAAGPVEYYNLQGVRVGGENLAPGVYIRRQGGSAAKIRIR